MIGGTLLLSREVNLHLDYKTALTQLGFKDVTVSAADRDALYNLIDELKPHLVLISFAYNQCCTPFMVGQLLKQFPHLSIAAVSVTPYPVELAVKFLEHGVKSCVYYPDGREQFYRGLECVRDGIPFISPSILARFNMGEVMPKAATKLTRRQIEVVRLLCNGFSTPEIAKVLYVSVNTINNHKAEVYSALDVRNEKELIRAALYLDLIHVKELMFYGREQITGNKEQR